MEFSSLTLSRRRLGITVVQPLPVHNKDGPVKAITIPNSVRDKILRLVSQFSVDSSSLTDLNTFILKSKDVIRSQVSGDVIDILQSLYNASSPISAVLLRNLPVDPFVPPNPTDGSVSLGKSTFVAEAMLVGFGELTSSSVIGYESETQYSNPWLQEGFPRTSPGSALTKTSDLSFHQDMSYHPKPPDILGLVNVREGHDRQLTTELVDNRGVLETLPASVVSLLRKPRFLVQTSEWVDASFQTSHGIPLLTEDFSLAIPVEWKNMVGLDKEAEWAVQMLQRAILEAPVHHVHFVPGDLLLFNNKRVVHARTPYRDLRFDGGDRVLTRSYFRKILNDEEQKTRLI
jgi:L-asparagine oxygenase